MEQKIENGLVVYKRYLRYVKIAEMEIDLCGTLEEKKEAKARCETIIEKMFHVKNALSEHSDLPVLTLEPYIPKFKNFIENAENSPYNKERKAKEHRKMIERIYKWTINL